MNTSLPLSRDHSKLVSEVLQLHSGQWLGEHVRGLLICGNVLELHCSLIHHVTDIMIFDLDVFGPIMKHRVLGHLCATLVVTPDASHIRHMIK